MWRTCSCCAAKYSGFLLDLYTLGWRVFTSENVIVIFLTRCTVLILNLMSILYMLLSCHD